MSKNPFTFHYLGEKHKESIINLPNHSGDPLSILNCSLLGHRVHSRGNNSFSDIFLIGFSI